MKSGNHSAWPFTADTAIQSSDMAFGIDSHGRIAFFNDEARRAFEDARSAGMVSAVVVDMSCFGHSQEWAGKRLIAPSA